MTSLSDVFRVHRFSLLFRHCLILPQDLHSTEETKQEKANEVSGSTREVRKVKVFRGTRAIQKCNYY